MDDRDVSVLLGLVRPAGSRWHLEAAIIARLAQLRGGGWCWAEQAAEWTGADPVRCRRALASLDARKVIKRDPGQSGRDHIRWCAVNEDWRRWRVEWVIDPTQVAAQLALAAQQRDESPFTRIFARSFSARSVARIARSFDARSWVEDMEEVTGIARQRIARSQPVENTDRALLIARSLGRRRAILERAILGGSAKEVSLSCDVDGKSPPSGEPTRSEEGVDATVKQLRARIVGLAVPAPGVQGKWLRGAPFWRLVDLVEEHGLGAVEAAVAQIEPGTMSPVRIVDMIGDLVLVDVEEAPVVDVEARVSYLRRMIDAHESVGAEAPQSLVDDLVRWQTVAEQPQEAMAR